MYFVRYPPNLCFKTRFITLQIKECHLEMTAICRKQTRLLVRFTICLRLNETYCINQIKLAKVRTRFISQTIDQLYLGNKEQIFKIFFPLPLKNPVFMVGSDKYGQQNMCQSNEIFGTYLKYLLLPIQMYVVLVNIITYK